MKRKSFFATVIIAAAIAAAAAIATGAPSGASMSVSISPTAGAGRIAMGKPDAPVEPESIKALPARYDNAVNPKPLTAEGIKGELKMERTGYTVSYNPELRQPNYVAWTLTAVRTNGQNRRESQFYEDAQLPVAVRALLADYYNSGLSRGHMCPAADNKWSEQAMRESFLLSNVCPQSMSLNGGDWEKLESFCRSYVRRTGAKLHIICGPVFSSRPPKLRRKRLYEPDSFFKAIVCLDNGAERGIAFIYANGTQQHPMTHYACTIDDVERLTGLNLFHTLPKNLQKRVKSQNNLASWHQ